MKLLSRYLLKEVLVPFGVWVAFLFLLLFVMSFLRGTDVLLGSAVTAKDLGLFTLYLAPHFLQQAVPIAFLLAILLGLGRLSEDSELVAMGALGVGPGQVVAGPLSLGVVLGVAMMFLAFTGQPWGLRSARVAVNEVIKRNLAGDVKSGVFYDDLTQLTLYAERVDPRTRKWRHVLVHDDREPSSPLLVLAREGQVDPGQAGEALSLSFEDGEVHRTDAASTDYNLVEFEHGEIVVGVAESFFHKNRFRSPKEELTPAELLAAGREAKARGESPRPFQVAFHGRIGQALMPLAFAVVGAPLAMSRRQTGRARRFLLTLGAYVLYYVLARVFLSLGEKGGLAPLLAGQLPNVIFAGLGWFAWRWGEQEGVRR